MRKTLKRLTSVLICGSLLTVFSSSALASCSGTLYSQGWETTFNMCGPGTTSFSASYWIVWTWSDAGQVTVGAAFGSPVGEPCTNALAAPWHDVTQGTGIDQISDPWIDYRWVQVDVGYWRNPDGAVVKKESSSSRSCLHIHPTPIVFHLKNDGADLRLTSAENGVDFDLSQLGLKQRIGWTYEAEKDGWLVLGNEVLDGSSLLGDQNEQAPPLTSDEPANGFRALRLKDDNHDGSITPDDAIWSSLNLWFDNNHNGIAEPDEMSSLSAAGVSGLSLNYKTLGKRDQFGNKLRFRSAIQLTDGSTRFAYDVIPTAVRRVDSSLPTE